MAWLSDRPGLAIAGDRGVGFWDLQSAAELPLDTELRGSRLLVTGSGPVSYTHLRAHETVLDLVCRLLLENKKKQRKKKINKKKTKKKT